MRNTKLKIVADSDLPFVRSYFAEAGELYLKPGRAIERADLLEADVLLVRSVTRVDERLLSGTAVKFVGTVTSGIDHLDSAWLDQAGIRWQSAAGYNAQPVAEYVIAVLAALQLQDTLPRQALRLGVVGVGHVGSRVAAFCQALGYEVLLCDPPRARAEPRFSSQALKTFAALDVVTVHTPLTLAGPDATRHLIDSAFLDAASGKNVLLNTSRGAVVDFAALSAERSNWTYCFDVWEEEPNLDLACLQKATLATPHLAGYSVQCRYRGIASIYEACRESGLIETSAQSLPPQPRQQLAFGGKKLRWQDVVLAIFNPETVTRLMKASLLRENDLLKGRRKCATLFDELRQHFIGDTIQRHEFACTTVSQLQLEEQDRCALTKLGITIL